MTQHVVLQLSAWKHRAYTGIQTVRLYIDCFIVERLMSYERRAHTLVENLWSVFVFFNLNVPSPTMIRFICFSSSLYNKRRLIIIRALFLDILRFVFQLEFRFRGGLVDVLCIELLNNNLVVSLLLVGCVQMGHVDSLQS
jgi:hypothetical protein